MKVSPEVAARLNDEIDAADTLYDMHTDLAIKAYTDGLYGVYRKHTAEANYYSDVMCRARFALAGLEWSSKRLDKRKNK
jgi:hypothetical protein